MILNERIVRHFSEPGFLGTMESPDCFVVESHPVCGDTIHLFIRLSEGRSIQEICFQAYGCATSIALSDMVCEMFLGMDAASVGHVDRHTVAEMLGPISPEQNHCVEIGMNLVARTCAQMDEFRHPEASSATSEGR